jgi:hypothetical protein
MTELFLDGAVQRMTVPANTTWGFDILVGARAASSDSAAYQIRGAIKNNNGSAAIVGAVVSQVITTELGPWCGSVFATNNTLAINVAGLTGLTIRWVASVRAVEIGY